MNAALETCKDLIGLKPVGFTTSFTGQAMGRLKVSDKTVVDEDAAGLFPKESLACFGPSLCAGSGVASGDTAVALHAVEEALVAADVG